MAVYRKRITLLKRRLSKRKLQQVAILLAVVCTLTSPKPRSVWSFPRFGTRVEVRHAFTLSCRAVPYRAGTVDSTVPAGTVRHGTARVRIGKIYSRAVPYRAGTVKNCQCERSISIPRALARAKFYVLRPLLDRLRMTYVLPVRPTRKLASLAIIITSEMQSIGRAKRT